MGDYNTLIVSAGIKRIPDDKLKEFEDEVRARLFDERATDSAYHATAPFLSFNQWHHQTNMSLIVQAKYNRGVEEFLDWLKPMVVDGLGPAEVWAINFSEYTPVPQMFSVNSMKEEDY